MTLWTRIVACVWLAAAGPAGAGEIMTADAWARATAGPPRTGAAYLMLINHGAADALIGVESPAAARVEIHTHLHEDGVMKMRRLERLALPEGATVRLAPGADHLMLFGLTAPLVAGETMTLDLLFASGDRRSVSVDILPIGAAGPDTPAETMSHGNH